MDFSEIQRQWATVCIQIGQASQDFGLLLRSKKRLGEAGWVWMANAVWNEVRADLTIGSIILPLIKERAYETPIQQFAAASEMLAQYIAESTGDGNHGFCVALRRAAEIIGVTEHEITMPEPSSELEAVIIEELHRIRANQGCNCGVCRAQLKRNDQWVRQVLGEGQ